MSTLVNEGGDQGLVNVDKFQNIEKIFKKLIFMIEENKFHIKQIR